MIPGTIEEWKKALKESKPGAERALAVNALLILGVDIQVKSGHTVEWCDLNDGPSTREYEYRVKPTARPWNAEDAKRHVGFAFRPARTIRVGIIGRAIDGRMPLHESAYWHTWNGVEYASPIPGTDPATWDWKKCEVVE